MKCQTSGAPPLFFLLKGKKSFTHWWDVWCFMGAAGDQPVLSLFRGVFCVLTLWCGGSEMPWKHRQHFLCQDFADSDLNHIFVLLWQRLESWKKRYGDVFFFFWSVPMPCLGWCWAAARLWSSLSYPEAKYLFTRCCFSSVMKAWGPRLPKQSSSGK